MPERVGWMTKSVKDMAPSARARQPAVPDLRLGPPELLVLDEPDNGLDARRLDALVARIKDHAAAGRACLLASHDAALLDQIGARTVSLDRAA